MSDSTREGESPLNSEDLVLLRLIRAGIGSSYPDTAPGGDQALAAYVMGTATPAQITAAQAALAQSPELRRMVLGLIQASEPSTDQERLAFERTAAPSIEQFPDLVACLEQRTASATPAPRGASNSDRRHHWLEWALGGWAVTATAAACVMIAIISRPGEVPEGRRSSNQAPPSSARPLASELVTLEVVEAINLSGPSRGVVSDSATRWTIAPSIQALQIKAEPPDVPDGSQIEVTLHGPEGTLLLTRSIPVEDFWRGALVLRSQGGFKSGRYTLIATGKRDSRPERVRYQFVLETSPAP